MKKIIVIFAFLGLVLSSFLVVAQVSKKANATKKIPSCENCKVIDPSERESTN